VVANVSYAYKKIPPLPDCVKYDCEEIKEVGLILR
jgi:hypothetical protein